MENTIEGPFEHFSNVPHAIDLILQHFNFKDLMRLSIVSSIYHDSIFNSPACMKKMKLVVNSDRIDGINKSTRRYPNAKIILDELTQDLAALTSKSDSWKCVELLFKDVNPKVLELCQNAEEITIEGFVCGSSQFNKSLKFNKLQTLKLQDTSPSNAFDIIKRSPKVKSLTLNKILFCQFLLRGLGNRPPMSALEELHISEASSYNFNQDKNELVSFITVHLNTIRKIVLDVWASLPVLKVLFAMPNLRDLELFELAKCDETTDWDAETLPISRSITRFWIEDLKDNKSLLKRLLKSCPNITDLKVHMLDEEIREIIRAHAPNVVSPKTDFHS